MFQGSFQFRKFYVSIISRNFTTYWDIYHPQEDLHDEFRILIEFISSQLISTTITKHCKTIHLNVKQSWFLFFLIIPSKVSLIDTFHIFFQMYYFSEHICMCVCAYTLYMHAHKLMCLCIYGHIYTYMYIYGVF